MCIVDCHSEFSVVKQMDGLSADSIIKIWKIIFLKYGLPRKVVSDVGPNFVSEKFQEFCRYLNIQQAVSSSNNHHRNGQAKVFMKYTIQKCSDTTDDIHEAFFICVQHPLIKDYLAQLC